MTSTTTLGAPVLLEAEFSHQGLATATLWLAIFATVTGGGLLWYRYGPTGGGLGPTLTRWVHIVLGIALLVYVMATYWLVPV